MRPCPSQDRPPESAQVALEFGQIGCSAARVATVIPRCYRLRMKVAISLPDPIFEAAERLAKQRRVPRSQVFAEALEEYLSRHGGDAVTAKLDEVYGAQSASIDRELAEAQLTAIGDETW